MHDLVATVRTLRDAVEVRTHLFVGRHALQQLGKPDDTRQSRQLDDFQRIADQIRQNKSIRIIRIQIRTSHFRQIGFLLAFVDGEIELLL